MGHANIYIRKENEEFWDSVENKSVLINGLLAKEHLGDKYGHGNIGNAVDVATEKLKSGIIDSDEVIEVLREQLSFKPCKHGADPKFCRFAKSGKPCK